MAPKSHIIIHPEWPDTRKSHANYNAIAITRPTLILSHTMTLASGQAKPEAAGKMSHKQQQAVGPKDE